MNAIDLRPGVRLWLDGEAWSLVELRNGLVTLADGSVHRILPVSEVVGRARPLGAEPDSDPVGEPVNVGLSSLTASARRRVEERVRVVRTVMEGDGQPAKDRVAATAKAAGVSPRTVERWLAGYRAAGAAGLIDSKLLRRRSPAVDPRWDAACLAVLRGHVSTSTPTMNVVLDQVRKVLDQEHGPGIVPCPPRSTAYRRLGELSRGRHAFGSGKARRSVAARPAGPYGRLRASRPGEYVVLDTTRLDVFAMEPVTLRWVPVELTVAQDLFSRCILGLRLSPVSTTSSDVANVLYQCVTPQPSGTDDGVWPFHGVPANVLVGTEVPDGVSQERVAGLPACLPEAIVVDHGKTYVSDHVIAACARLGITVQPAIPYKPTDKPTVERFFRTLREGLLQHLPAYKGPDVFNRGLDVEADAFFYVAELEQVIREWVGQVYHRTKHDGLCVPEVPGFGLSPAEMFEVGLAKFGGLSIPATPDLPFLFLDVAWRTIQHYGVEVEGRRYDGEAINGYRNRRSAYAGRYAGKWPIFVDAHDVRRVWFQDPESREFSPLVWEHAAGLGQPFSKEAAEYTKRIAVRSGRHVDPLTAVADLLGAWSREEVTSRRDRSLARRLAATRATATSSAETDDAAAGQEVASLPGVIDLLAQRELRARPVEVVDDVDALFEAYYADRRAGTGFEVFDE